MGIQVYKRIKYRMKIVGLHRQYNHSVTSVRSRYIGLNMLGALCVCNPDTKQQFRIMADV